MTDPDRAPATLLTITWTGTPCTAGHDPFGCLCGVDAVAVTATDGAYPAEQVARLLLEVADLVAAQGSDQAAGIEHDPRLDSRGRPR